MMGHRFYDPEIGRFISPDSADYLDLTIINGLNFYAYCNNDPVKYYNPSGHIALELFVSGTAIYYLFAAIGALLIGLGTTIASTSGKARSRIKKARERFTRKIKFRRGRKPQKHHTPGRGHKKYFWLLLWRIIDDE